MLINIFSRFLSFISEEIRLANKSNLFIFNFFNINEKL
jgi:hypothetical protein